MLKLPSPFLSASVNVCFSHVMRRWVQESHHEQLLLLLLLVKSDDPGHKVSM